jgi:hypothetical protein
MIIDDRSTSQLTTKNAAGVIVACSQQKQLVKLVHLESR